MRLDVTHNARDVNRFVLNAFDDQVPFATARAINDAALASQRVQRVHQQRVFEQRRPRWQERAVKIKPFATKRKPEAKISIDPPGGRGRAEMLTQHESDSRKTPFSGRFVAVPTEHVRRTASGVIRKSDRPSVIRERGRRGRGTTRRGEFGRGTFLRMRGRRGAIWERTQDGGLRPLYWLVPSVPLDQRLDFFENVRTTVLSTFADAFTRRFDEAMRTAR